jgi:hypothetical protein
MTDNCNHPVKIRLQTNDIWDVESRLKEINQLRAWLDEITEWQEDMYELRFHSSGSQCVAWLADERHALICALKWS